MNSVSIEFSKHVLHLHDGYNLLLVKLLKLCQNLTFLTLFELFSYNMFSRRILYKLISLGFVACNSTWMPSSSLLILSLELTYTIFILTFDVSGDLHIHMYIKINKNKSILEGTINNGVPNWAMPMKLD